MAGWLATGVAASPASRSGFDEQDLRALLRDNPATGRPVDSITELEKLLPRALLGNFTFVYDSRSPFRAGISPRYPRVILFTDDARLVLSFLGDPAAEGADVLETLSFDDAGASFALHAYVLPAATRRGFQLAPEAADCGRCHGADPRPIFDSYPLWPGFYGSVLDTFPHDRLGRAELKHYRAFLGASARTGVYAPLRFDWRHPVTPYLDPRRFDADIEETPPDTFPILPNTRLGMALTELNRQRIFRQLSAAPDYAANETRILAELLQCPGAAAPPPTALLSLQTQLRQENRDRLQRLGAGAQDREPGLHAMQELGFVEELAAIDQAAQTAGADRSEWSMALEKNSLAFFDGILSGIYQGKSYYLKEDLIYEILAHLALREPKFRPFFAADAVFARLGYNFGHRIDIGRALASCPLLRASG